MQLLNTDQINYLAVYLSACHKNAIDAQPNQFDKDVQPNSTEALKRVLFSCKTKEQLYEVLEDYAFITDPLFLIMLDLLLV
jgi:hypothetical protein